MNIHLRCQPGLCECVRAHTHTSESHSFNWILCFIFFLFSLCSPIFSRIGLDEQRWVLIYFPQNAITICPCAFWLVFFSCVVSGDVKKKQRKTREKNGRNGVNAIRMWQKQQKCDGQPYPSNINSVWNQKNRNETRSSERVRHIHTYIHTHTVKLTIAKGNAPKTRKKNTSKL